MRAGRWDRAFFIDLPSVAERQKIFEIHLAKQKANIAAFDMPTLLRTTEGYTGAEIEQAVIDAMYLANAQDKELNNEALVDAVTRITPTSETRREDINQIRSLRIKASIRPITSMFKSRMALDENSPSRTKRLTLSCRNTA